jgi:6-phosphogluconolactonase
MTSTALILHAFPSAPELCDALASFIIDAQREAVEKKGRFTLALSGGSLPKQLGALIGRSGVKWDKWCVRARHAGQDRALMCV